MCVFLTWCTALLEECSPSISCAILAIVGRSIEGAVFLPVVNNTTLCSSVGCSQALLCHCLLRGVKTDNNTRLVSMGGKQNHVHHCCVEGRAGRRVGSAAINPARPSTQYFFPAAARPSTRYFYSCARPPTHYFPPVLQHVALFLATFWPLLAAGADFGKMTYTIVFVSARRNF